MHDNANEVTQEIGRRRRENSRIRSHRRSERRFRGFGAAAGMAGLVFFAVMTTAVAIAEMKNDKPATVIAQSNPTAAPTSAVLDEPMTTHQYERWESQTPRISRKDRQELPTAAPGTTPPTVAATPAPTTMAPTTSAPPPVPSPSTSPPREDEEENEGRWPWPWDDTDPTPPPTTTPPPTSPSPTPEATIQPTTSPTDGEVVDDPTATPSTSPLAA